MGILYQCHNQCWSLNYFSGERTSGDSFNFDLFFLLGLSVLERVNPSGPNSFPSEAGTPPKERDDSRNLSLRDGVSSFEPFEKPCRRVEDSSSARENPLNDLDEERVESSNERRKPIGDPFKDRADSFPCLKIKPVNCWLLSESSRVIVTTSSLRRFSRLSRCILSSPSTFNLENGSYLSKYRTK